SKRGAGVKTWRASGRTRDRTRAIPPRRRSRDEAAGCRNIDRSHRHLVPAGTRGGRGSRRAFATTKDARVRTPLPRETSPRPRPRRVVPDIIEFSCDPQLLGLSNSPAQETLLKTIYGLL